MASEGMSSDQVRPLSGLEKTMITIIAGAVLFVTAAVVLMLLVISRPIWSSWIAPPAQIEQQDRSERGPGRER